MFEQFMAHIIWRLTSQLIYNKFKDKLPNELLLPYIWFLKYKGSYAYHILLTFTAGIITSTLLYLVIKYIFQDIYILDIENQFKKLSVNQFKITKFRSLYIFLIYTLLFIIFGFLYHVDILYNTMDIFMAVVSAGILSISTYFQFYFSDNGYDFRNRNLELESLKIENDNCIQILNMTIQITLFSISGIIVAGFLKWIFKIDPIIFHTQENIIQLSIWAIWLVTILLGIVIGVIGKIFEKIQHIKYRIIKIDSILKDINNNDEIKKNIK